MKLNKDKSADFYHFPVEETDRVMAEMAQAEKTGDLAALKRCARLLLWLWGAFQDDLCGSFEPFNFESCQFSNVREFNAAWRKEAEVNQ
ncbi:MAG: hypothetical protein LBB89_03810 [Treponema sp.]|jgi:hypothetical protein|nr:hypothetical protein [Treponema sp.]